MVLTGLLILSSGFFLMTFATIRVVTPRARNLFYGWKLVGLSMVAIALASGPVWSGVGVWVKALELQFGWSRTQLTGAFALAQMQGSIVGPFFGYLIDRLGPQRMVLIGLTLTGLGFILFSRTTNLPTFYLAYVIIMMGITAGTWLPFMATINRWFIRRRSTAMAISMEGDALGSLLLVPALAWAVTPGHLEWSATALWIGLMFLVVAWPISRFVRLRPEDYGQQPDGDPPANLEEGLTAIGDSADQNTLANDSPDFNARQAIRTSAFWFITFGDAFASMLIATMAVHLIPLLTDQGLSLQNAAYVWSVMMVTAAVFQPVGGYLGDRLPKPLVLFGFTTLQAVGFTLVAFIHSLPIAILVVVLYGAGHGGLLPIITAMRGEYFGRNAFATITGISEAPLYLFMLAAPLLAATMFDSRGDYTLSFLMIGALGSMSGVCFLFAKKPELVDSIRVSDPVSRPA